MTVVRVTVGRRRDGGPVPIGTPALSWVVEDAGDDWMQSAAEIRIVRHGTEWIHAHSDARSVHVPWPFEALAPGEAAELQVRVRADGPWSPWSEPKAVTAGFLAPGSWVASYIGVDAPDRMAQPFVARRRFILDALPARATLVATAQGVYQGRVNGVESDDAVLKPGWTAYQRRVVHEWTDVTALLTTGENVLAFTVAGGWFTEEFGFAGNGVRVYGDQPSVAAQLVLEFGDGTERTIVTDGSWQATASGLVVSSGIYQGEHADGRTARPGWSTGEDDDGGRWAPVALRAGLEPSPAVAEPVRRMGELPVRDVITTPSGKLVLDFAQNLVGRLRITVSGPPGTVVTLRHAEVLEHGELATRPLRAAAATDSYTLAGSGPGFANPTETWEPQFTFHGFRFAQIDGWPGTFDPTAVVAVLLHSDLTRTGWFESSHELVNRLHENVVWSMRGNFLSLPTDCPQRDERLGWTGDIQVFAPTAVSLYDCDAFLSSWLDDLSIEQQRHGGIVPFVVPDVLPSSPIPAAAWGDAATVVPRVLFEHYGDARSLERQFESMRSWSDHIAGLAGDRMLWEGGFQFGDWLDPDAPPDQPDAGKTDAGIVATAYFARSAALTAASARDLGLTAEADFYAERAARARAAFLHAYVTPSGRMVSDSPTAYSMAIAFDLASDPALRTAMGERLAFLVRAAGYRLGTGFVGTPIVLDALVATGHLAAAGRLVRQTANPSWLYAVTMGATTIWERWDSMLEDGSINPGEMTSFNHYAFGAVADWLHRSLAGLGGSAPGFGRFRIQPTPLAGFDFARAVRDTPFGRAESGWSRLPDGIIEVRAVIPANTRADVILPDGTRAEVGSGRHRWAVVLADTPRSRIRVESKVGELVDDENAFTAVLDALTPHDDAERAFRRQIRMSPDASIRDALSMLPLVPNVLPDVEAALNRIA